MLTAAGSFTVEPRRYGSKHNEPVSHNSEKSRSPITELHQTVSYDLMMILMPP